MHISERDVLNYILYTGDTNPLHKTKVVPGNLVVHHVMKTLRIHPKSTESEFIAPIYIDDKLELQHEIHYPYIIFKVLHHNKLKVKGKFTLTSFNDTHNDANILKQYDRYTHYHTPEQRIKYYANYFLYNEMPDLATFKQDLENQKAFHKQNDQHHLLFIFPENKTIPEDILAYAKSLGLTHEFMELYETRHVTLKEAGDEGIVIKEVINDETLNDFLHACAIGEIEYGQAFVDLKRTQHVKNYNDKKIIQLVAYDNEKPVGKLEAIINDHTLELDDFYVDSHYRNKGIGTKLQRVACEKRDGRSVILIADGNDTAKDMYQKQGYKKVAERHELLLTPKNYS